MTAQPITALHAAWCSHTHSDRDACLGEESRVPLQHEPLAELSDGSFRRPFIAATIDGSEVDEQGFPAIALGYDERQGHFLTVDEAAALAVELVGLVTKARAR